MAPHLLSRMRAVYVVGDRGYDANELRAQLADQDCRAVIPPHPKRREPHKYDRRRYKRRHRVENFFQRLKRYRRVATRYEKLAATFFAMVCFAALLIWL